MKAKPEMYEGAPCTHGHETTQGTTWRLCSTGECVKCSRERKRRSYRVTGWLTRRTKPAASNVRQNCQTESLFGGA